MYHLSDIRKFERCKKLYWLSKQKPQDYQQFVYYNENIIELVKEKLKLTNYYEGFAGDDGAKALAALDTFNVLVNARFVYQDLRIKVPFMIKSGNVWNVYFTFTSCYPKEYESIKMADTCWVLKQNNIEIGEVKAIHLNALYVRESNDKLNLDELLIINNCLYNTKNKAHNTIAELIKHNTRSLDEILKKLKECDEQSEVISVRSNVCTRGNKCSYFDCCFETPQDNSVLNLVQSSHKLEMHEQGIRELKDVDVNQIEGTRHQFAQIMASRNGSMFIDRYALTSWIDNSISYPISYLDFEWETYAFPPYRGMKPYDVLAFQYSLHIEEQNKPLQHKEYLGMKDCREEFIQHLLKDIPKEGTILVFNMEGAEKLRLIQLSNQFPQYAEELLKLCDRMVDLSLPFSTGNIYDIRMAGMYSLKKLVTVFSDYRYSDLDISYGMDAVRAWRMLGDPDDENSEEIRKHLFEYCAMDTYAEYIVLHAILKILGKE